jgi:hypothetical protein
VSSVECVSRLSILLSMSGTSLAVIVWLLDLQLSVQSLPITTKVVGSNSVRGGGEGGVLDTTSCDKVC